MNNNDAGAPTGSDLRARLATPRAAGSLFDLKPHPSGALLAPWTRAEVLDEGLDR